MKQAENQLGAADGVVSARLPETYQWLLIPGQANPQAPVEWQAIRLSGSDPLAMRASKKLGKDGLLSVYGPTVLRLEMDCIPLWRGKNHVPVRQLVEDFARYLYLPRLKSPEVLLEAIRSGLSLLLWHQESFAYADSLDEGAGRYRGLRCGQPVLITSSDPGLLVRPEVAFHQQEAEAKAVPAAAGHSETETGGGPSGGATRTANAGAPVSKGVRAPKRFHGSVILDPTRVGRDAGRIGDEVIAHLVGLMGSDVKVTLEIEAEIPNGTPDNVVRTVTENSRTLKFTNQGFEEEQAGVCTRRLPDLNSTAEESLHSSRRLVHHHCRTKNEEHGQARFNKMSPQRESSSPHASKKASALE
ncbi:MAG: hypothetical protein OJF47_002156 [Nitrospira sp.]|nr:MAG: hypothetical protein OJF47_002156 [Nitrospira sp.]